MAPKVMVFTGYEAERKARERVKLNEDEMQKVRNFATEIVGLNLQKTHHSRVCDVMHRLLDHICYQINYFGDDGMGDKPADMCRVEYWLQHLSDQKLKQLQDIASPEPPKKKAKTERQKPSASRASSSGT